jgi:hypothetical protein
MTDTGSAVTTGNTRTGALNFLDATVESSLFRNGKVVHGDHTLTSAPQRLRDLSAPLDRWSIQVRWCLVIYQ